MTDAPERIWVDPSFIPDAAKMIYLTEYVRADLAPAWQPIETAPKDGSVIFVWYEHRVNQSASFDTKIKMAEWISDLSEWRVAGVGGNVPPVLTHWMPLPTSPEGAADA